MTVSVSADGTIAALNRLRDVLIQDADEIVKDTARYAKKQADVSRLYEDKTGRLRQSTVAEFVRAEHRSFIENSTPYARFVEEGQRPHRIEARDAPMLRFYWEKLGRVVEFRSVEHPGTKARPVFQAAGYLGHTFLAMRLTERISQSVSSFNQAK